MDDYGPPDLRHLMASKTQFCKPLQFQEQFSVHRNLTPPPPPPPHYHHHPILVGSEMVAAAGLLDHHRYTSMITTTACHPSITISSNASAAAAMYGMESEHGWNNIDGANNNNSRWPRQETLTLLEIRSALDSKFKETNQKGPLWDEVSRIMAEEYGFQRTGKKCKEKFENLYKYYKKTKEGKSGRQDGKHYRFFRQLEAIYGDHHQSSNQSSICGRSNPLLCHTTPSGSFDLVQNQEVVVQDQKIISCESLSSNNSTEFDQNSPSENNGDNESLSAIGYFMMNQSMESLKNENKSYATQVKKKWKAKVEEFVSSQMGKVIKTQEALMEKMVKSIQDSADERIAKEEEWRKLEAAKYEREVHEFWTKERAWVETRDVAIMEALSKYTGQEAYNNNVKDDIAKETGNDNRKNYPRWTEHEVASLIQLRTSSELTFQESEYLKEEAVWKEIAAKMGSLGYTRSGGECKEKWENISVCFRMTTEGNKMHKQETKTNNMYFSQMSCYEEGQEVWNQRQDGMGVQLMDEGLSPSCSNMDVNSSSLHIPFNGGENLWDVRYSRVINSPRDNR